MRSRWLDWPNSPQIIEKGHRNEATKPTKPGFGSFGGSPSRAFPITRTRKNELPVGDVYAERMQAALREINRPDYPAGMIPWLRDARPDLYRELIEILPEQIHYHWSQHKPLEQFEQILQRLVETHGLACELYRGHLPEEREGLRAV